MRGQESARGHGWQSWPVREVQVVLTSSENERCDGKSVKEVAALPFWARWQGCLRYAVCSLFPGGSKLQMVEENGER